MTSLNEIELSDDSFQLPEWENFKEDYMFLMPDAPELKYRSRKTEEKNTFGWGQRKLGLVVLALINYYWDPETNPEPVVVYAGAAPGTNIDYIIKLYPQITWHLYDPRRIAIKEGEKVKVYNQYFTDETAQQWEGKNVIFISDIRTVDSITISKNNNEEDSARITEYGIWKDMLMQQQWVKIMKPLVAQLKFRLPYSNTKFSDDIDHNLNIAPYLSGFIFLQPWVGPGSSESRLIVTQDMLENNEYLTTNWKITSYENKMFYHNAVVRNMVKYYNIFYTNDERKMHDPIDPPELDNSWDSTVEAAIFNDYLVKVNDQSDRMKHIKGLSRLLTIKIRSDNKDVVSLDIIRKDPFILKDRN